MIPWTVKSRRLIKSLLNLPNKAIGQCYQIWTLQKNIFSNSKGLHLNAERTKTLASNFISPTRTVHFPYWISLHPNEFSINIIVFLIDIIEFQFNGIINKVLLMNFSLTYMNRLWKFEICTFEIWNALLKILGPIHTRHVFLLRHTRQSESFRK